MQNLILRALSSLMLVSAFFVPVIFKTTGYALIILIAFGMLFEWCMMTHSSHIMTGAIVALLPLSGLLLIIYFTSSLIFLAYFCLLWSVDVFAFIGGKIFEGPKLAPKISPNKTWSGLICGALGCCTTLYLMVHTHIDFFKIKSIWLNVNSFSMYEVVIGITFALLAQTGDLFISYYKRKFGVKHTSNFIPGHGGVLDRFDGTIFTAPFALFILYLVCLSSK